MMRLSDSELVVLATILTVHPKGLFPEDVGRPDAVKDLIRKKLIKPEGRELYLTKKGIKEINGD